MGQEGCRCTDHRAIEDLLYSYCLRVDALDAEGVGQLFVEEPLVDYGPFAHDLIRSRGSLVDYLRSGLAQYTATQHFVSNTLIAFESPTVAQATSYMHSWQHLAGGGADRETWGRYDDRFLHAEGGWLFSERRLIPLARQGYREAPAGLDGVRREVLLRRPATADN